MLRRHVLRRRPARLLGGLATTAASALAVSVLLGTAASAGTTPSRDLGAVLLVVDVSGSMLEADAGGARRIDAAKSALGDLVRSLPEGASVGLRVFGESGAVAASKEACTDSRLVVPIGPLSGPQMLGRIEDLRARGWTPIGFALTRAERDLPPTGRGTVVLVSDGVDECYPKYGPEPCEVAADLSEGAVDLKVHTIGFTVDDRARTQLKCIARVTGGQYRDARDAGDLSAALRASVVPPRPPVAPVEQPSSLLVPFVVGVALLAAGTLGVNGFRALLRRRRRAYW